MHDDRPMIMASTFRAWWQNLADQDPDFITPGNTLDTRELWATLVTIGKQNGAIIDQHDSGDPSVDSWPELHPAFDWNGEIAIGVDMPIAEIERATGISDEEPLA